MQLTQAIDRYLASVEGAGYSAHTLKAYSTRLNEFALYCRTGSFERSGAAAEPVALAQVETEVIQAYLAALRRKSIGRRVGVSSSTLSHAYAVLSGFFSFAERVLRIDNNPMRDVIKPRGDSSIDTEFHSLTVEQLDDLLNTARNGWTPQLGPPDLRTNQRKTEDFLIVALMGHAGLRVSEVCSLDQGDIVDDVVTVFGKGRKRRTVPLSDDIMTALGEYKFPEEGKHLFSAPRNPTKRISANAIEQRIPRLARYAGIFELRVTPHTLRHTFGSLMLAADPTALVPTRDLMGHESIETTNKYAHTRDEARRLALASFQELRSKSAGRSPNASEHDT